MSLTPHHAILLLARWWQPVSPEYPLVSPHQSRLHVWGAMLARVQPERKKCQQEPAGSVGPGAAGGRRGGAGGDGGDGGDGGTGGAGGGDGG